MVDQPQTTWEKPIDQDAAKARLNALTNRRGERARYFIGFVLLIGAIGYLMATGTLLGQRFFITVDEVIANPEYVGQSVRITGAVIGDTINITPDGDISFTIAHLDTRTGNLAEALFIASNNPGTTLNVVVVNKQPKPELLQHEAQAIIAGKLGEDGVFYATELQFKCPSRFEESGPVLNQEDHPGIASLESEQ